MISKEFYDDFFACSSVNDLSPDYEDLKLYYDFIKNLPEKYKKDSSFSPSAIYSTLTSSRDFFRKKEKNISSLAIYWLSQVREKAEVFCCNKVIPILNFNEADMISLAHMSQNEDELCSLQPLLLEHGIILIYNNNIPGMKVDGVSFLLDDSVPVVGLSLRYDRLDYFWFTLMHELSHIVLHYDYMKQPFINDLDGFLDDVEQEANGLAMKTLVPRYKWRGFLNYFKPTKENIYAFANDIKIHPAIVAGKYMRELNNYSLFQDIVNSFSVREALL